MAYQDLTLDERKRVDACLDWIYKMADKYGGICYEKNGKSWDWGQALCRLCYGADWQNYIVKNDITTPSWDDLEKGQRWFEGETPEWFDN